MGIQGQQLRSTLLNRNPTKSTKIQSFDQNNAINYSYVDLNSQNTETTTLKTRQSHLMRRLRLNTIRGHHRL
jgi:hypothetical protein